MSTLAVAFGFAVTDDAPATTAQASLLTRENTGVQRYRVTEQDRSRLIRVCDTES